VNRKKGAGKMAKKRPSEARRRYGLCCFMTLTASLLGFVNPILSSFIAQNIIDHFNLTGIIPSLVSIFVVKGARFYLRARAGSELKGGSSRAPVIWLQKRISRKLWWLEPMVVNWGWVGLVLKKLTGGVSVQVSAAIASMLTDTVNSLVSGIVYYYTQSYLLSLLAALVIPAVAVLPWLTVKTVRYRRVAARPQ
jgi:hypothetical protein